MTNRSNRKPTAVLATFGTHGDLHPMLALAIALKARGIEPTLAAAEIYRSKVEAENIGFAPMRPDVDSVATRLGIPNQALLRKVAANPQYLIQHIILPHLRESYEDALAATVDADIVVTQSAAYGARIAADKRGLPHVAIVLQPMIMMSAYDPPVIATAPRFSRWVYARGTRATRTLLNLGRAMARRWGEPIETLRRDVGLPGSSGHPLFEGQVSGERVIALYSPLFGAPQPDHPRGTAIVGFAFYDNDVGGRAELDGSLEAFLSAGSAPVVFTQGTSAIHDAEDFIRESLAAIEHIHARAVFVLDEERAQRWSSRTSSSVLVTGYAPYSKLFPRALVNVHHGGVGTTAQALRAGRPQLIAPYLVDQPDNAARVARLGVGRSLHLKHYRATRVATELQMLIDDAAYAQRASDIGSRIANEDGAAAAADLIAEVIRTSRDGIK